MRVKTVRYAARCVGTAAAALLMACSSGSTSAGDAPDAGPSGDGGDGAVASSGDGGAGDAHGQDGGSSSGQDGGSGSKGDAGASSEAGGADGGTGGGDAQTHDAAGDAAVTSDPFNPQSCPGQPLTEAQAVPFFQQGATQAVIGSYTIQMRQRSCNAVTGCGAWGATTTAIGVALGGGTRALSGTILLNVQGTSVVLALQDSTEEKPYSMGATCSAVDGTPETCSGYSYDMGDQWGGSGGLFPTMAALTDVNSKNVLVSGVLTSQCLRLAYSALDQTGNEVQQFVLLAPVAPGAPLPPDPCPGGGTQMACGSQAAGQTTCCQNGLTTCPQSGCDCWGACQ